MGQNAHDLITRTAHEIYESLHVPTDLISGKSPIPETEKFFGPEEVAAAMNASAEFWLTAGPHTEKFERNLAKKVAERHEFMVKTSSSANLLAKSALTSKKQGERRLLPGDEV